MAKQKSLEQLRAEKEQVEKRLAQEQHKLERLENRKKYLEKGERTKRTHRLCNLGGTVESLAPEVKNLTRTEMTELMEHIFGLPEVQRAVRHMEITHINQANRGKELKAIRSLNDYSATYKSLKPVYDGLQKIKFEKSRAKYKTEHADKLKMFYTARRKLTEEFPDGKVDMGKLSKEYDTLEQEHETTYAEFKTVREDLQRLWKVKSNIDTAVRFNQRTAEQKLQNQPQIRHKKEDMTR